MRKILFIFLFAFLCFGCKDKKEALPKRKVDIVFDLPKSILQWEKEPMSMSNHPTFYKIKGINYAYKKDSFERYEAAVKNGEYVEIRFYFDSFDLDIGNVSTGKHLIVSIHDTNMSNYLKTAFLTGGIFGLLDELKTYDLYFEQRGLCYYYNYNSLSEK